MKQVDLVGHDPKLDSQKSTNLHRTSRTGIAQSCAIQFERATVEQMDKKCLAIVKQQLPGCAKHTGRRRTPTVRRWSRKPIAKHACTNSS